MLGIFVFGCFVFSIVAVAVGLIVWGIGAERHDREELAREVAAEPGLGAIASTVAGDAPQPPA
ncbi:MAG: hypothetical protein FJW90_04860 [Actinobacteria bacterium]|nr:hypothetical protein [Actinomycetota bacterium]